MEIKHTNLNINHSRENYKSGYVALIGKTNVGKSTLMNSLLGQKLSIVTAKPQTTRHSILGILSEEDYQIIFFDTPGLLSPRYQLHDKMLISAQRAISRSDLLLFMIEPEERISASCQTILMEIIRRNKPVFLIINKIDKVEKEKLLPLIKKYSQQFNLAEIVPISALKKNGLDILKKLIVNHLPNGYPYYPDDIITDFPERFFVSEIIREKIFLNYSKEIPFSTTVVIDEFKEHVKRKDYIRADIIVEKISQKGILIGKKGSALKKIGQLAREEIELFLGRKVYLDLYVKVREKWRQKETFLKEFGYK